MDFSGSIVPPKARGAGAVEAARMVLGNFDTHHYVAFLGDPAIRPSFWPHHNVQASPFAIS